MKISHFFSKALICLGFVTFYASSFGFQQEFQQHIAKAMTNELEDKTYTQKEVQQDVDFYIKTMHEVCPFPYVGGDSLKVAAIVKQIKNKGAMSAKELHLSFLRLGAAFNSGHVYIQPPKQMLNKFFSKNGKIFPLAVAQKGEKWVVNAVAEDTYQTLKGKIITKINGHAIASLITSFKAYVPAVYPNIDEAIGNELASFLWLKDINAPYQVELVDPKTQQKFIKKLVGYGKVVQRQADKSAKKSQLSDHIEFKPLSDKVAYINSKSMTIFTPQLTKEYNAFVQKTFAEIKAKKYPHLIIDLRENGGGRGQIAELLLDYIANKPYRQSAGEVRRVSQQFKDFIQLMPAQMRDQALKQGGLTEYPKLPNGTNMSNLSDPEPLKKIDNRFGGKVWCLIGPGTFSAAMMMANAIEDYDLGTLVGEPTGGIPNELSDVLPCKTPNAKISFTVPSVLFTRANGDASNTNRVLPDVTIRTNQQGNAQNKDALIAYVLKQVVKSK